MNNNYEYEDDFDGYEDDFEDDLFSRLIARSEVFTIKNIEIGDLVRVTDWSYSLNIDLKSHMHIDYLSSDLGFETKHTCLLFKVVRFTAKDHKMNDTVIKHIVTGDIFFIQKGFLRIPILFKKF